MSQLWRLLIRFIFILKVGYLKLSNITQNSIIEYPADTIFANIGWKMYIYNWYNIYSILSLFIFTIWQKKLKLILFYFTHFTSLLLFHNLETMYELFLFFFKQTTNQTCIYQQCTNHLLLSHEHAFVCWRKRVFLHIYTEDLVRKSRKLGLANAF